MCIAVYKPMDAEFPYKRILKRCFYKNPDGAGFMVANGTEVEIHKGFMGFRSFWKALREARTKYGDDKAYVMHFRISTQGGVRADGCHPFPLSKDMCDLRKLDCVTDIGIAHNGIIDLCTDWGSSYSQYYSRSWSARKTVDYSDTMKFITEYLSLIINGRDYWKNEDALELIDKLCESRLAILDGAGHCELIGKGWECSDGVWYSNSGYKDTATTKSIVCKSSESVSTDSTTNSCYTGNGQYSYWNDWYEYSYGDEYAYDPYSAYLQPNGMYDFSQSDCPATLDGDYTYCPECIHQYSCWSYDEKDDDEERSA